MMAARYWLHRALTATCLALALCALQPVAWAQSANQSLVAQSAGPDGLPIVLRAEEITQDQELGVVVARGNVEVTDGKRILLADTLSYNQNARTVSASGNVRILEPTGEVIFVDFVELSEDLLDGTIENLRILLEDNARIAAAGGRRTDGNTTEMAKAVYSPCDVCVEDPTKPPLWQVSADRVIHDQEARQVEYFDAVFQIYGVPIAYTPYLTHPDPTIRRQTGFLTPSWGTKDSTGSFARTPFFWNIGPDRGATIDPILTHEEGVFYSGEYRQAFDTGKFDISGSWTIADEAVGTDSNNPDRIDEDVFRGHIFSLGVFNLDETWRTGWSLNRSTDQTYLRKFGFWTDPGNSMTSTAYVEGFRGRNYMSARAFSYQDLRLGTRSDPPLILPMLDYNGFGDPDTWGGRWSLEANARGLTDEDDADSQRVSVEAGYRREFISESGVITTLGGSLRGDVFNVDQVQSTDVFNREIESGVTGRIVPRAMIETRYPFARYGDETRQIIEPIAALNVAANGGNDPSIPNNDSLVTETDDINLFVDSRSAGYDRVETGQRFVAGLNILHFNNTGGRISAFLGQSFRLREDETLAQDTGVEASRSDWVGRIDFSPSDYLTAFYRFNFDKDELIANRSEFNTTIGGSGLKFTSKYTFIRDSFGQTSDNAVEQISLGLSSQWNDYWSASVSTLQDLREPGTADPRNHATSLKYEDECFIFDGRWRRSFTSSADVPQEDLFIFKLTFKTLGEVDF